MQACAKAKGVQVKFPLREGRRDRAARLGERGLCSRTVRKQTQLVSLE